MQILTSLQWCVVTSVVLPDTNVLCTQFTIYVKDKTFCLFDILPYLCFFKIVAHYRFYIKSDHINLLNDRFLS